MITALIAGRADLVRVQLPSVVGWGPAPTFEENFGRLCTQNLSSKLPEKGQRYHSAQCWIYVQAKQARAYTHVRACKVSEGGVLPFL